ncbi:MAG: alpha-galactosidase [Lentisphaerae bacterium]|nr:alpha-galactosidase [Lentisphaerota bacterium]
MPGKTTTTVWDHGTVFRRAPDRFWLARLCGLPVGREGEDNGPPAARGVALLRLDGRRYEGAQLALEQVKKSRRSLTCRWRVGDTAVRLTTAWTGDAGTGVVSRRDTLTNAGSRPVVVSRCLARVALPPGLYECYTQASVWCRESQGAWNPLHTGLRQSHLSGRTTEGGTPYLALRLAGAAQGVAFHVLPRGNWTIRVTPVPDGGGRPFAVIELGLSDENLHRTLRPRETFELPEILCQPLPGGEAHLGAPVLHRYLLSHHYRSAKPQAPVVYNTWFDQFEILDVPRLRTQLAAAKELGCEVFVVDAGWYGAGEGDWGAQTGDWREKPHAAFRGRMRDFADEVRAAGLGFGLWMEPERFGALAPIRARRPEWFIPVGNQARLDLTRPPAWRWLRGEIVRLVKTYRLAWMKIDFNFRVGVDDSGAELSGYTDAWHRLLDDVRAAYPEVFFEGCASGAMRADLETMRHFDNFFLSDSTNPTDMLRITQGSWLRLPPGRIGRWPVIRSVERAVCDYGRTVQDSAPLVLVPTCVWNPVESVGLDYALLAGMPGMMGISGDMAGLTAAQRARVAEAIAFFKTWRRFIAGAVGYLLTPPVSIECREGWIALQLQRPGSDESLLFVYHMGNVGIPPLLRPMGLNPARRYALRWGFGATAKDGGVVSGADLERDGLRVAESGVWQERAVVCVIRAERKGSK